MAGSVNIDLRNKFRVGEIRIPASSMRQIMGFGVDAVKSRLAAGRGPADAPALPLSKQYAIRKSRKGLGNVRNLTYSGDMLRSFMPRRMSDNQAVATVDGQSNFLKAGVNQKREPWVVFSPRNQAEVIKRVSEFAGGAKVLKVVRS